MIHRLAAPAPCGRRALAAGFLTAAVGLGGAGSAAVDAAQNSSDIVVLAPEWTDSLPFVARFEGEIVDTSTSRAEGYVETRTEQYGAMGVAGSGAEGSAWATIANDLGLDLGTQRETGAQNDYEVTHFDGRGGAVRMSARQCPPPSVNNNNGTQTQGYTDATGAGYQPCQCTFEATPIGGIANCTLPTKYSCLPERESCVASEEVGCPLSEWIQRRWWGASDNAAPVCAVRPLEAGEVAPVIQGNHSLPWNDTTDFAVCEFASTYEGQTEAVAVGESDDGIPEYDVEGYCYPGAQRQDCMSSYFVNVETLAPATAEEASIFLDVDPVGFLTCLGDAGAANASEAFCHGRGTWMIDTNENGGGGGDDGDEPSPFRCICDDPAEWAGDRCDVAAVAPAAVATTPSATTLTTPATTATATVATTASATTSDTTTAAVATTPSATTPDTTTSPTSCLPCHPGTFGPCQHDAPGDATCAEKEAGDGSGCPVGFSECDGDGGGATTSRAAGTSMCAPCFGQSDGPCQNSADTVCYDFLQGSMCPPGTQLKLC